MCVLCPSFLPNPEKQTELLWGGGGFHMNCEVRGEGHEGGRAYSHVHMSMCAHATHVCSIRRVESK